MTHDDAHAEFHAKSAAMMEGGGLSGDPAWEVQRVINHWSAVPPEVLVEREAELADLRACRDRIVAIEAARAAGLHQHGGTDAPECRTCTPAPERDTEPSGGLTEAEVEDLYRRWLQKVSFTHLTSAVERIIAARTQAPTDDTETCTYCGQDFPKPVEIHHAERDCQFTNAGGFLVWAGETGGECCWVGYECPYHFRLKNGLSTEGLSPRPPTDVAEGGLVERLRALTAEYDAMGNTHAPGRDVADDLRALLVPVRPPIDVAGLCHWTQNRDNVQHHQTHDEFHFGNTCPYAAVAAILRGEPDPREPLAGGGS